MVLDMRECERCGKLEEKTHMYGEVFARIDSFFPKFLLSEMLSRMVFLLSEYLTEGMERSSRRDEG